MKKTEYNVFDELTEIQTSVMLFIIDWVRDKKTPVPHSEVLKSMEADGLKQFTIATAINSLLRKKYIRRGYSHSNKTFYVQLRNIHRS